MKERREKQLGYTIRNILFLPERDVRLWWVCACSSKNNIRSGVEEDASIACYQKIAMERTLNDRVRSKRPGIDYHFNTDCSIEFYKGEVRSS